MQPHDEAGIQRDEVNTADAVGAEVIQDPVERIGFLSWHLGQATRNRAERILAPLELTLSQFQALLVLAREPGLSSAELARRCAVTAPSMGKAIESLVKRGMVEARPHAKNRRIIELRVTNTGVERAARGQRYLDALERDALERFTKEEWDQLRVLLQRLILKLNPYALPSLELEDAEPWSVASGSGH